MDTSGHVAVLPSSVSGEYLSGAPERQEEPVGPDSPLQHPDQSPRIKSVDEILAIADTPEAVVHVKEWDTDIKVRGLTKRQQIDIRQRAMRDGEVDPEWVQRYMWLEGVVEPKFSDEQIGQLFEKNAGAVDTVLTRLLELSGMDPEAIKKREATFRKGA